MRRAALLNTAFNPFSFYTGRNRCRGRSVRDNRALPLSIGEVLGGDELVALAGAEHPSPPGAAADFEQLMLKEVGFRTVYFSSRKETGL